MDCNNAPRGKVPPQSKFNCRSVEYTRPPTLNCVLYLFDSKTKLRFRDQKEEEPFTSNPIYFHFPTDYMWL